MAKGAHRASGTRTIAKRGFTPLGVVTILRKLERDRGTTLGEAQAKSLHEKITVLKLKCFCPHGASDLRAQNRGSTRHQHQRRLPQQPPLQHVISTKGGCRSSRRSKSGRRGIRTPEGETSRFTVCSRWPLEYPPSGSRVGRGAEIVQRVGGCRKRFCEFVHGLIGDCLRNRNACARARQIINGSGPVIGPASLPVW